MVVGVRRPYDGRGADDGRRGRRNQVVVRPARTEVAHRVATSFERLLAAGYDRRDFAGASEVDIDALAILQDAPAVPEAVREMLRLIGVDPGPLRALGDFGVRTADAGAKDVAACLLDALPPARRDALDPERMLVIADDPGAFAVVIGGRDLADPDPPVHVVNATGEVRDIDSVTAYFADCVDRLLAARRSHPAGTLPRPGRPAGFLRTALRSLRTRLGR